MTIVYTRFIPATNLGGSRIAAFAPHGKKVMVTKDHSLSSEDNHFVAAQEWLKKNVQDAPYLTLVGHGETPSGAGYAFIFTLKQEG
jgi:hypothetical protein